MSFLETWQKVQDGNDLDYLRVYAKDKDVVIIGGGDTGCDCIATSLRQVNTGRDLKGCVYIATSLRQVDTGRDPKGCDCITTSLRQVNTGRNL